MTSRSRDPRPVRRPSQKGPDDAQTSPPRPRQMRLGQASPTPPRRLRTVRQHRSSQPLITQTSLRLPQHGAAAPTWLRWWRQSSGLPKPTRRSAHPSVWLGTKTEGVRSCSVQADRSDSKEWYPPTLPTAKTSTTRARRLQIVLTDSTAQLFAREPILRRDAG